MNYKLVFFYLLIVNSSLLGAQELINKAEKLQKFDYNWKFSLKNHPKAITKDFDDNSWEDIILPHDWSIKSSIKNENKSTGAGGFFENGLGWYRKEFNVPESLKNKKISIHFGGVYMNTEVFINGRSLGIHPYGYTPFDYDLTPFLKFSETNIIAVKVDNSQQINSRWFSGSGIYRHVWLKVTDFTHIEDHGIFITTKSVNSTNAEIHIKSNIVNESNNKQDLNLKIDVKRKGKDIASREVAFRIYPGEKRVLSEKIKIENPKLWSPETPNLYTATVSVENENSSIDIDKVTEYFGIRTIDYSAEKGFVLNGKSILINGGNVHHDNGALGAAAFDRAEIRKVKLLKNAGFNGVRTSHNPPSEVFLDACDSIGLLVVDESFDGWRTEKNTYDYSKYFDHWYKEDVQSMVLRDRNHPAVVFWSIGNEIIERKNPEAVKTAQLLKDAVYELDSTRPVTSAMTTWDSDWEIFDPLFAVHDIGGYNYQLHRAESDHERVPSRIILQTESYPKDAFFCWDMSEKYPYIIGDFVWTAMDYLGESGIGRYFYPGEPEGEHWSGDLFPWHGAYCGDIDLIGWRKPISHYRDILWGNDDAIYMAVKEPNPNNGKIKLTSWAVWPTWESWTWPGYEDENLEVEVYTRHEKVQLYLNNKLIGEKNVSRATEFKAVFEVPYKAGELTAKAFSNQKELGSFSLKTAKKVKKIDLKAERKSMIANGQDLIFINVELQDKNGVINPISDRKIEFSIDGPAEIIAVDNANLKNDDPYFSNKRKTWKGKALVVLRSTLKTGSITLTANAEDLPKSKIEVSSVKD